MLMSYRLPFVTEALRYYDMTHSDAQAPYATAVHSMDE